MSTLRTGVALELEVDFGAPSTVRAALASMGRTEDVRFSPSGRRIALACYAREQIGVADVEIASDEGRPGVSVTSFDLVSSPALREPHGVDFLDDETLVVANRAGSVAVLALSPCGEPARMTHAVSGDGHLPLDAPGSVVSRRLGQGRHEVLVCNNWANTITRLRVEPGQRPAVDGVAAAKWLDLPDGLAISNDGQWLAVSNHDTHSVLIYEYPTLTEDSDPVGVLRGIHYPHGLRFTAEDRHLLVADAGAPFVHVFARRSGWRGAAYPAAMLRVMDDDTFARGRHNPQEGGPKGIDIDPGTNVLAVTSECLPLAFFDVAAALDDLEARSPSEDVLVGYELRVQAETARLEAAVVEARAQVSAILATKAWRATQPVRSAYGAILRVARRRRRQVSPAG